MTIKEEYSEKVAQGLVIKTDPGANSSAEKGAKITLYVSKGVAPQVVPNVVGKVRRMLLKFFRQQASALEPLLRNIAHLLLQVRLSAQIRCQYRVGKRFYHQSSYFKRKRIDYA